MSIYVPQSKRAEKPVQCLIELAEKRDRSVNYLVVEAILEYLNREEKKQQASPFRHRSGGGGFEGIRGVSPTEDYNGQLRLCPSCMLTKAKIMGLLGHQPTVSFRLARSS